MSGLSRLAYDGRATSGIANLTQTVAAQNATALVDGIPISKASNSFSDVIEGVTLNLLKENTPSKTTLSVSRDTAGIQASVQSFVKAYNDLNKTIGDLTKYDATNQRASTLTGDATVRSLQTRLRGVFNTALETAGGGVTSLGDIGISFQVDGTLKLDTAKLATVLADSSKDISTLFAAVGKPTDSLLSFTGSTADTKNGTYGVNVTALATQGKAVASALAVTDIVAGSNDTLELTIDGVSASITLAAGTYTSSGLASEIQSKLNALSALAAAKASVDVTEAGGVLTMTSKSYGAASTVAITGGNAKTALFGTPIETAGLNVSGTIGNSPATGLGQVLTGTGDAAGLAITVAGGVTGDRGTVKFARGYAYELDNLASDLLEDDSLLDGRMDGISASIKDIATQTRTVERTARKRRKTLPRAIQRARFIDGAHAADQHVSAAAARQPNQTGVIKLMFTSAGRAINAYVKTGVETGVPEADPHRLVLMLFEGALAAIAQARLKLSAGDVPGRGKAISKAISIIQDGLRNSLDVRKGRRTRGAAGCAL